MNKLFRVSTRSTGVWVIAPDENTALTLSGYKGKKKIQIADQTDFYLKRGSDDNDEDLFTTNTLRELLASGRTGPVCIELGKGSCGTMTNLISNLSKGIKPITSPSRWIFSQDNT
jgi:hypothetical protein